MQTTYEKLVDFFGGQVPTAEALNVNQGAVSNWVRGKHGMSPAVALRAERLTAGKFTAAELCPSVFADQPTPAAGE
ncbi:Cro/CI family transcriptional regulator [uncultured Halomonas sp.]|uniref:transcriptional regulator n=1 Tax=uncultured Halomonas sp. TaxID=173971 RepID=UPI002638ACE6|nr:Cro/CI family transcriptional regulator [uncultured Halomonas sp.]